MFLVSNGGYVQKGQCVVADTNRISREVESPLMVEAPVRRFTTVRRIAGRTDQSGKDRNWPVPARPAATVSVSS
jgi:hypothetical protein